MFRKLVIGSLVVGLGLIILIGGVGFFAFHYLTNNTISAGTFDSVPVGATQEQAQNLLPGSSDPAKNTSWADKDQDTASIPAHARCEHFMARDQSNVGQNGLRVYRFCFLGGKLVQKKAVMATDQK
jgi:hypothetical protein